MLRVILIPSIDLSVLLALEQDCGLSNKPVYKPVTISPPTSISAVKLVLSTRKQESQNRLLLQQQVFNSDSDHTVCWIFKTFLEIAGKMDGTRDEKNSLKFPERENGDEKYPWHLFRRTILLLNVFLGILIWSFQQSPHCNMSSVWCHCRNYRADSAGPEGPARGHTGRGLLHSTAQLHRLTGRLLLYGLLTRQTASV